MIHRHSHAGAIMKFAIAFFLLVGCALPAFAKGAATAPAVSCEKLAEQVANKIGAQIVGRPVQSAEVLLKVNNISELKIVCASENQRPPSIFVKSDSVYPHAAFYKLLAVAGQALTGRSLRRLNKGAHNCHRSSMSAVDGQSRKGVRGLSFECRTSSKDSFSTFLFHRKSEHRP